MYFVFEVCIGCADALASIGARASADTIITKFIPRLHHTVYDVFIALYTEFS